MLEDRRGTVLHFPARHGRASAGSRAAPSRAAISASCSADKPASCAVVVASTELHHSAGMLLRWNHLRAEAGGAPMSEAIAPGERQSPIIARKDVRGSAMPTCLGQSVLKSKAKMSHDLGQKVADNAGMADRMSETEEKLAFIRRVRLAREARYPTQKPMLTILEVEQGTYKQYETRTPMPHRLIPKFCAATGVSIEWLLTGEGEGPKVVEIPRHAQRRSTALKKGRAA